MTDLDEIKNTILSRYPLFGSATANINFESKKEIKTVKTDGRTIYYDPEFLAGKNVDDQVYLIAHEICHVAFNHITRSIGKNPKLWSLATDAVVNAFLEKDGFSISKDAVTKEQLKDIGFYVSDIIGYSAEELYEGLFIKQEEFRNDPNSKKYDKNDNPNQSSEDENLTDDEISDGEKDEEGEEDNHSMWEDEVHREMQPDGTEETDEKNGAGNNTNSTIRKIDGYAESKPLIDWRLWLKEALCLDVDWSYENAVIEDGIVKPNLETYPLPETEILLDTSGSIHEDLLKNFLSECRKIIKTSRVKVGCFDTEFYGWNEVRELGDIEKIEYLGGGGTNFETAAGAFTKRVENKIVLTDGYARMPRKAVDAIWVVYGTDTINPPGGRVIHIPEEQAKRLYKKRS